MILDLFRTQVDAAPDSPAISDDAATWSYGALDRRAASLAAVLYADGARPETLIGVCLERSVDAIVAILAVLKTGAAWVPLDPSHPRERRELIIDDAGLNRLISADNLTELEARSTDELRRTIRDLDFGGLDDRLAYVIYTSGTTGRPKGVQVTHRGLPGVLGDNAAALGVERGSRILQAAALGFDASVLEIFTALTHGAHLQLANRDVLLDGTRLIAFLRDRRVSQVTIVPSMFRHLAALAPEERFPCLIGATSGGEACTADVVEHWASGRNFCNVYAPTEATIYATRWQAPETPKIEDPPLGRAIDGMFVRLFDEAGTPIRNGAQGEIGLAGDGVARGYQGRPGHTADRFRPDPESTTPGARLYRTGDLARRDEYGDLHFAGRVDDQVQVRGVRVELGGVEATLRDHPAVREAAVSFDGERLFGHVTAPDASTNSVELTAFLSERLPAAMIPTRIDVLDELPLTPTGKVDRRALLRLVAESGDAAIDDDPESTIGRVAAIVKDLLGHAVGPEENLIEAGAHSLLLAQLINRLRHETGRHLPLADVFRGPQIAAIAALLDGEKSEARVPPIVALPRNGDPLQSFSQERIFFLHRVSPHSLAYNVQIELVFDGAPDPRFLARAFEEIVRRHEILRTTFVEEEGRPVQKIHDRGISELPVIDFEALREEDREKAAHRAVERLMRQPFDPGCLPLIRTYYLRHDASRAVVLQMEHHLIHDGWALTRLLAELVEIYLALQAGRAPVLPHLEVQYADFARWQRDWLKGETLQRGIDFWKRELAGVTSGINLPTDRPRPARPSFEGRALTPVLDPHLADALRETARREGVSLFATCMSAFQIFIRRLTGKDDVVLGSGLANRRRREIETMLGMVINTVPIRGDLSCNPTLRELFQRNRRRMIDVQEYQDVPFGALSAALDLPRGLGHNPLMEAMFAFHDSPMPDLLFSETEEDPITAELRYRHNHSAKSDLLAIGAPIGENFRFVWEYSTDLFDDSTTHRWWGQFLGLLRTMNEDPLRRIDDLEYLDHVERHQLLHEWNDTAKLIEDAPATVPELFARHLERDAEASAVIWNGGALSYADLNRRARRTEALLRERGCRPGEIVGLCMLRSPETMIAMLAIVRVGAAYVPLDPSLPVERLQFMIEDTEARRIFVDDDGRARLEESSTDLEAIELLVVPEDGETEESADPPLHPESTAYVIYTSGSTGRPKGVCISHRALISQAVDQSFVPFAPDVRTAQVANLAFDASVLEIWAAWLSGGAVGLTAKDALLSPDSLAKAFDDSPSDYALLTPAVFSAALQSRPETFDALRYLAVGGESLDPGDARRLLQRDSFRGRLIHAYGPTENTVISLSRFVPRSFRDSDAPVVPLGRPIDRSTAHVVDRRFRPVPILAAGELVLGGDGVASCYHRRPARTAGAFVPDPYSADAGARLYRSGDLVRRRASGEMEFLGRIDHQIKLRGLRIELGEIEAALKDHPRVLEVVVDQVDAASDDRATSYRDRALAAWIVPADDRSDLIDALREDLGRRLPSYMIPSLWSLLDELPLNNSGKVSRRELPDPQRASSLDDEPLSETEAGLAEIWREILGLDPDLPIGRGSGFFELGGHSLLATRVIARITRDLGAQLPIVKLFSVTTLSAAAQEIEAHRRSDASPSDDAQREIPHRATHLAEEAPISYAQERLWLLDRLHPGDVLYNMPVARRLSGPLDAERLTAALAEIERRHEVLRSVFDERDDGPVQIVRPFDEAAARLLPIADLSRLEASAREREAARLTRREGQTPFDLRTDSVLRRRLLRLADDDHVLLTTFHHIASDGWSVGVFLREMSRLYKASDPRTALPELPIQYADYAVDQKQRLDDEALAHEVAWWRERLNGAERLEMPLDRPRGERRGVRCGSLHRVISAEQAQRLEALARGRRATLFMLLRTAFDVALFRLTGQTDLVVGSPTAGREHPSTEPLIGFFVNLLALRSQLRRNEKFVDALERFRDDSLAAYEHQELPFNRLIEALHPDRESGRNPLFDMTFALQNLSLGDGRLGEDVDSKRYLIEAATVRFDLEVHCWHQDEDLIFGMAWDLDLFDQTTVRRWLDRCVGVLETLDQDSEARIRDLDRPRMSERQQLLHEWNDRPLPEIRESLETTLPQAFAIQVRKSPQAPALTCGDETSTYAQLDARSDALAFDLLEQGVGPEQFVGVALPRSIDLIVALLAVLKTGAAYLPLDPEYPAARREFMLGDAQPSAVIDQETINRIDFSAESPSLPEIRLHPDHPAYVIYTSGSTGRPKGVVVTHQNVLRLFETCEPLFDFSADDVWTLFHSYAFDFSVWEIWGALLYGGRLVVVPKRIARDADAFLDLLQDESVTVLNQTPSAFDPLLAAARRREDETGEDPLTGVRRFVFGGEALEISRLPLAEDDERWINMYGITETTVHVSYLTLRPEHRASRSLIGRALADLRVEVFDRDGRPAPIGAIGEMFVAGAGLARGYLHRPALTAERFVPDPSGIADGGRLYRTGDLARRRPDGALDYFGRTDHQVKIRGFRIELGEIENALCELPEVEQAAATVHAVNAENRLAAFVVVAGAENAEDWSLALRDALERSLPEHMIPSYFTRLDALPLTNNGKLDRRALPEPELSVSSRPPRNDRERLICNLFAEILDLDESVGIDDSFFHLGGHSLLAARLVRRIGGEIGREVPIHALFSAPTVAGLVRWLERSEKQSSLQRILPLRTGGSSPPLFCFAPVTGLSWTYANLVPSTSADLPIYGVQSAIFTDGGVLPESFDEIVAGDLPLLREITDDGPLRVLGWSFGGLLAHAAACRLQEEGVEVEHLILLDSFPPQTKIVEESMIDQAVARAREQDHIFGSLEPDAVPTILDLMRRNLRMMIEHPYSVFRGSVRLFRGSETREDRRSEEEWRPHVDGPIVLRDLPYGHHEICGPEASREIGPLLNEVFQPRS